ncbi:MAG: iron ABC transporter permease [Intrasporangium sp.]|uniref:ABC transporter permease n=1 Tax=Intrasporangium sp. TaxID=1925024 RepID=UPI0026473027|nr:iron ABC transporter permease [Intrasporangium sp.]MDN5796510.1 iron ABC transporter permease [Intrasporangium sp.]
MNPSRAAIAIAAMAVGALSLLPFAYLFAAGMSTEAIGKLFTYPTTAGDIIRTVGLTLSVSAVCVVVGVGAALLLVRTTIPFRKLLTVLLAMPLAIPGFVAAYAAYSANLMFAPRTNIVTTFAGATAIIALTLYPYVFLAGIVAVRNLDPAQEEVARSLGTRPVAVFWRITVPQLRPAIASSVLIVALHVLAEYGAMVQLRQRTLTTTIMANMLDYGDYEAARSLSLLLAGLAFVLLVGGRLLTGRAHRQSIGSQTVRPPTRARLGRAHLAVLVAALVVPLLALGPTVYMTIHGLTSPHRQLVVNWAEVLQAARVSLTYAVWAGLLASVVALPVAWWVSRHPSPWSNLTERSVWLAHAIPGAILALALVFLATRLLPGLYKTPSLLVIAYVILYLPLAVANQRVGLHAALTKYDEAAASLGSGAWQRLRRVSLPIALPGLATGALLVGLDASKELTTTLMLLPFNTQTLATGLWATTNGESLDFTAASPYAVMLLALGSIPVYLIMRRTVRYIV